jgi:hypothetical protein
MSAICSAKPCRWWTSGLPWRVETSRATLNQEKQDIATAQDKLRGERESLEELKKQAEAFSARVQAYSDRVADFNKRSQELAAETRTTSSVEIRRRALATERTALEADRVRAGGRARPPSTTATEEAVEAFNAKAAALDTAGEGLEPAQRRLERPTNGAEADRAAWVDNCADRRYREDDEIAIKAASDVQPMSTDNPLLQPWTPRTACRPSTASGPSTSRRPSRRRCSSTAPSWRRIAPQPAPPALTTPLGRSTAPAACCRA